MSQRLSAEHRRAQIIGEARALSLTKGLYQWGMSDLANQCGVSKGTVSYHLSSATQVRKALVLDAIEKRDLSILAQAIISHDPVVASIDPGLRDAAIRSVVE